MKRLLSPAFENDLLNGKLHKILEFVQDDDSLDLEIRNNYLNIYYRGGNLLRITPNGNYYSFEFDCKYYTNLNVYPSLKTDIEQNLKAENWLKYFPVAKQAMDFYFSTHSNEEREYQQLVVRENNYSSIANGTDYFVIDMEYDNHEDAKFDIVAVEWISEGSKRKLPKSYKPKLVVFEMKYGDGALNNTAGMKKHLNDYNNFISNKESVNEFKKEMIEAFEQKRKFGLIPCLSDKENNNEVVDFDEKIEFVFLIANHDPASKVLYNVMNGITDSKAKFIVSNFYGYGLYKTNLYSCADFLKLYSNQIYELNHP